MDKFIVAETVDGYQLLYYAGKSCICVIDIDVSSVAAGQILADNLNNCHAKPQRPR